MPSVQYTGTRVCIQFNTLESTLLFKKMWQVWIKVMWLVFCDNRASVVVGYILCFKVVVRGVLIAGKHLIEDGFNCLFV